MQSQKICIFRKKDVLLCRLYPILIGMVFGIVFCLIFTAADVFPEDDSSRTDSGRASGIDQAPWFSFPYPGQWGNPTFLASAVIAMISGPVFRNLTKL